MSSERAENAPDTVAFPVEGDMVTVIGVFHGARDPKQWQDRL